MKKEKPLYMFQCVKCRKNFYTHSTTMKHCGTLTQWIDGIEGKGINRESEKIVIEVQGRIVIPRENLDRILALDDPQRGLIDCLHFGYVKTKDLVFNVPV